MGREDPGLPRSGGWRTVFKRPLGESAKTDCRPVSLCTHGRVQIRIRDIRVPRRIRSRHVDISDLVDSMNDFGLLQPILLDQNRHLIAGFRRLAAARSLGWETIDARVVTVRGKRERLLLEIEENTVRRGFSSRELDRAERLLDRWEDPGLLRRLWLGIVEFFEDLLDRYGSGDGGRR